MDFFKKRKLDENGLLLPTDLESTIYTTTQLTPNEGRKLIERFTIDQLLDILQAAVVRHTDVLESVRSIADPETSQRKLFIRGLGWETTNDSLRSLFSAFGELEEAVVILDKQTGKSKGYGFVTYKHVDGALRALREPSKKIDGRVTVTQLAAAGIAGNNSNPADVSTRKIYVANVPFEMPSDKLLALFAPYGEIEEGPLGYDKLTGKSRGFALFLYKTPEGAHAALVEPVKNVDGRQLSCKLAIDGKKGKPSAHVGLDGVQNQTGNSHGDGMGMVPPGSMQGSYNGLGGPGSMGPYTSFSGRPTLGHNPRNPSLGGSGYPLQPTPATGVGNGGYGGGPYGGYGGGNGDVGFDSAYRLPPTSSVSIPSTGYLESAHYSSAFPSQYPQGTGVSSMPRAAPGGSYSNRPYY